MRIDIKTKTPVKDKDIRALWILSYAMSLVSERMIYATLQFLADHYGYRVIRKEQL